MADRSTWAQAPERFALPAVYHEVASVIGWDSAIDFGMKVWRTKRLPSRSKSDPVHGRGYGTIYVPKALTPIAGADLIRLAGHERAEQLVSEFPGIFLEFPCIVSASIGRRNKAIAEQFAAGSSARDLAFLFDLTERHIRRIAKDSGIDRQRSARSVRRMITPKISQADEMAALAALGKPQAEIAALYGVSTQAVSFSLSRKNRRKKQHAY